MKNIKLLFFSMLMVLTVLTSCQNNDDIIDDMANVTESASLRSALSNLDLIVNDDGTLNDIENPTGNLIFDFCFDFVYPINLEYNNGTTVTVNNFEELIIVLINSTEDLYIIGIEFPFQVEVYNEDTNEFEIISINNEEEFAALIESCGFDESCECPDIYDPVCVEIITDNETILITFPNACLAECEGFTEEDFIDCGDSCEDECPDEYDPVCVEITTPNGGTKIITFQNECFAECEGYTEEDFIDCENDSCEDECSDEYNPVCVETPSGEIEEYHNICFAFCDGYGQEDLVDCENDSCEDECPEIYDPVCVETGGQIIEFDNFCLAQCEGFTEEDLVDCENDGCEDNCPQNEDPVCVLVEVNNELIVVTFLNACYAECEGFTEEDFIDCEVSCEDECPDIYDPVCVETANGGIEVYDNICLAFCDGYDQGDIVDCDNNGCEDNCPQIEDPVCVEYTTPTGETIIITFINACYAECEGYTEEDFVDCNPNPDCYEYGFPISMTLNNGTSVTANSNQEVDEYLDLGYVLLYPIELIINNETILVFQGILEGAYGPRCE